MYLAKDIDGKMWEWDNYDSPIGGRFKPVSEFQMLVLETLEGKSG